MQPRTTIIGLALFAAGYACGAGSGGDATNAATTRFELNGGSLAQQLEEAGPPPIASGIGIAERVPDDGTRHFTLTVATENRETALATGATAYACLDAGGKLFASRSPCTGG